MCSTPQAAEDEAPESGELQQLRQLARELRGAALGSSSNSAAFPLQRAAQWLQSTVALAPDAAAAKLGELQAAQLLGITDPAAADEPITAQLVQQRSQLLVRLAADAPLPTSWKEPLNGQVTWFGPARPAAEVRQSLHCTELHVPHSTYTCSCNAASMLDCYTSLTASGCKWLPSFPCGSILLALLFFSFSFVPMYCCIAPGGREPAQAHPEAVRQVSGGGGQEGQLHGSQERSRLPRVCCRHR